MKTPEGFFDFQDPFDIMVGLWSGMTTSFDEHGHYESSVASLVRISWVKKDEILHYQQKELANLDQALRGNPRKEVLANIISHDFSMAVEGKACHSVKVKGEKLSMKGVETRPGVYLFHLTFPQGDYYNNQIYAGANERHIIGPFVPKGRGRAFNCVVSQTFTRISYDPDFVRKGRMEDRLLRKRK